MFPIPSIPPFQPASSKPSLSSISGPVGPALPSAPTSPPPPPPNGAPPSTTAAFQSPSTPSSNLLPSITSIPLEDTGETQVEVTFKDEADRTNPLYRGVSTFEDLGLHPDLLMVKNFVYLPIRFFIPLWHQLLSLQYRSEWREHTMTGRRKRG